MSSFRLQLVLMALVAIAGVALATQPDIFRVVKEQSTPVGAEPSPVDQLQDLLTQVEDNVANERNTTENQYEMTMSEYKKAIDVYNFTYIMARRNRTIVDTKLFNLTQKMEAVEADLATLDSRVELKAQRIADLQKKIVDGEKLQFDLMVDFQRSKRVHQRTIQGIVHVMDQLGPDEEISNSLKQKLNEKHEPTKEFTKKEVTGASLLELGAKFSANAEELKELLTMLHENMHLYVKSVSEVQLERKATWEGLRTRFNQTIGRLQEEQDALTDSEKPNQEKLVNMKNEYVKLEQLRAQLNDYVEQTERRLKTKIAARDALVSKHKSFAEQREVQLSTVNRLQNSLEMHDGEVPKVQAPVKTEEEEDATL